jgi:DnaJ-class molecular chaperone
MSDQPDEKCQTCNGKGEVPALRKPGRFPPKGATTIKCPDCGGRGKKPKPSAG